MGTQVKSLKPRHEAIMDYMVANPQAELKEVAAHFGHSYGWICTLTRSDLFAARLREKRDAILIAEVQPLQTQLTACASVGLQRLMELLPTAQSLEEVSVTTDRLLKALGMGHGPASVTNVAVQANMVDPGLLAQARERMLEAPKPQPLPASPDVSDLLPAPQPTETPVVFDPADEMLREPATSVD